MFVLKVYLVILNVNWQKLQKLFLIVFVGPKNSEMIALSNKKDIQIFNVIRKFISFSPG